MKLAGLIIDPALWDPKEKGMVLEATATAEPLEEVPGVNKWS